LRLSPLARKRCNFCTVAPN